MKNNIIIAVIHYRPGEKKKKNCPRNEEGGIKKKRTSPRSIFFRGYLP